MFTTVAAYIDPIEGQLALGLLQAEGIPARLDDTGTAIANWEWRLAIGGMRLRVPDAQAMHARRVLAALDAGEYALDEETWPDDASDDGGSHPTCATAALSGVPKRGDDDAARGDRPPDSIPPGSTLQPPSRESLSSRVAWAALMLFGIPLPWRRRDDDGTVTRRA